MLEENLNGKYKKSKTDFRAKLQAVICLHGSLTTRFILVLFLVHLVLNHSSVYTVFCLHGCFFNVSKIRVSRGPPVYEFNLYLVGPSSQNSKTGIMDWIEIDFIFLWYWLKCHKFDSSFAIKCIPLLGDPQFSKGQSSFVEASVRFRHLH